MTDSAFLEIMRSLDVDAALAYYRANDLGGPLDGPRVLDKTLVRLHKERAASLDIEDHHRQHSEDWLTERRSRRTKMNRVILKRAERREKKRDK